MSPRWLCAGACLLLGCADANAAQRGAPIASYTSRSGYASELYVYRDNAARCYVLVGTAGNAISCVPSPSQESP